VIASPIQGNFMRYVLIVIVLAGFLCPPAAAQAREYPWCARYDWTTYNCGFVSFQQCLATVSGIGGICERNPRYTGPEPRRPKRPAR
jgi:hypothetical protein